MIQIIGIEDESLQISGEFCKIRNFLSHVFLVDNKFIVSKFISNFVKEYKIDFDYKKFSEIQLKLLGNPYCLFDESFTIDINGLENEEILGLVNFWEVLQNYTALLGYTDLYNRELKISGESRIIKDFYIFKKYLVEDINFLPESFLWKFENIRNVSDNKEKITLQGLFGKGKEVILGNKIIPSRSLIRFFLYHFFGHSVFTEEKFNRNYIGIILEPENFKDDKKYTNYNAQMIEGGQYEVIEGILNNKNTLGILSTGSGKSATFLLCGMLKPGTSFIISPLKSLIDDQYLNLENKYKLIGITGKIHSGMDIDQIPSMFTNLSLGKLKFLYCAPERLQLMKFLFGNTKTNREGLQNRLNKNVNTINQLVIDEAHCLSERGHDFRFAYLNIALFKDFIQNSKNNHIPIVGLTATASEIVRKDIVKYLDIQYVVEESSLNRPNLSFEIRLIKNPNEKPESIKNLLLEGIDPILGNVANRYNQEQNKNNVIKSITRVIEKNNEKIYENGGITFTIYGPQGKKTNTSTLSQTAERLYHYLKSYLPIDLMGFFMGECPDFVVHKCPNCGCFDILEPNQNKDGVFNVYKDNIYQKYINHQDHKYLDEQRKKMCKDFSSKEKFFYCNNSSCLGIFKEPEIIGRQGLSEKEKREIWENRKIEIQNNFKESYLGMLIATKGFGMGIDKPNIRYIIHATLSSSLESYYQEVGRAGRDNQHSHCVLLFSGKSDECIKETEGGNNKNELPCLQDPSCNKYLSCPRGLSTMCDIARQQKMLIQPLIKKIKYKEEFLHTYLNTDEFLNNPESFEIETSTKVFEKLKDLLFDDNNNGGFSHPLIEFWQLYFFWQENKNKTTIKKSNNKNISLYEKLIYRLMNLGIIDYYYKDYPNGINDLEFSLKYKSSIRTTIRTNEVSSYLSIKLGIDEKKHHECYEKDTSNINFLTWLETQDDVIKSFWKLIYRTYDKVHTQRKEMLRYLYDAIMSASTKDNKQCFRSEIIKKLTGLKQGENEKKCGFCSGCVDDAKFETRHGLLDKDEHLIKVNPVRIKKISQQLTQEEQKIIKEYESILSLEGALKSLFYDVDTYGFLSMIELIEKVNKNKYDITGLIQKSLESGTYNPWYYFLSAYYEAKYRTERIDEVFRILFETDDNQNLFEFGKRLGGEKSDINKDIITTINNQNYSDSKFSYFQIGLITGQKELSEDEIQKLFILSKAYKSFTSKKQD